MRTLIALLLLCTPALAQPAWTFGLSGTDVLLDPSGSQVSDTIVSFQCSEPGVGVGAVQLCFSYDPDQLRFFGIQSITPTDPDFFAFFYANEPTTFPGDPTTYGPGVGYIASLFDFTLVDLVDAATPTELFRMQLYTAPTATVGTSSIQFVGGGVLDLPGQFDTFLEVAYVDENGASASYEPNDFPGVVTILAGPSFERGDASNGGGVTLVDAIRILEWGFVVGSPPVACEAAIDFDGDGDNTPLPSCIQVLDYLFAGGPPPPEGIGCFPRDALGLPCDVTSCP